MELERYHTWLVSALLRLMQYLLENLRYNSDNLYSVGLRMCFRTIVRKSVRFVSFVTHSLMRLLSDLEHRLCGFQLSRAKF